MKKREREVERDKRLRFWREVAIAVKTNRAWNWEGSLFPWLNRLEAWALGAGCEDLPQEMPLPRLGWYDPPAVRWEGAGTKPPRPGQYLVELHCAEEAGVPASVRIDLLSWGEYAFTAPDGFTKNQLLPGQRYCPRDRAIHGFGWHAYDRTTDACTVWHPSRTDERVLHWSPKPEAPSGSEYMRAAYAAQVHDTTQEDGASDPTSKEPT